MGKTPPRSPALSPGAAGPLLLVCVLLAAQVLVPLHRKLRAITLGPKSGAVCFVTEPGCVALCWGLAAYPFGSSIGPPNTVPLLAMVIGAATWALLARLAPREPWRRIGLGLFALGVAALSTLCLAVVVNAAERGEIVHTATGILISAALIAGVGRVTLPRATRSSS